MTAYVVSGIGMGAQFAPLSGEQRGMLDRGNGISGQPTGAASAHAP
jgi:hypothetical protein